MQTDVLKVHPEFPDLDAIEKAARIIYNGGLVIFPTETVYGIAANFADPKAMQRLREVKKRADDKPFSILIPHKGFVSNYTSATSPLLYKLIDRYWPGPLTVVVPAKTEGFTVGIRMPDHPVALKLLKEARCAVAAPSANFEGNPAPVTCDEALRDLDGLVDLALDAGESAVGVSSSVVDLSRGAPVVLREGAVSTAEVEAMAKRKTVLFVCTGNSCRSVMGEYLLKAKLEDKENVEVLSAGTSVFIQSTASSDTVDVLRHKGIDATSHYSQPVTSVLLKKSDLILVMTQRHRDKVLEHAPSVQNRVYLLREFVSSPPSLQSEMDIPDPMGRSRQAYEECMSVIDEAVEKIVKLI